MSHESDFVAGMGVSPKVEIGSIAALPPLPSNPDESYRATADEARFPHTVFELKTFHYRCSGKMGLPVSGPAGTEMEIVELCAPWGYKVVFWVAFRDGKIPDCPDYESTDPNEELFDVEIGTVEPKTIDGVRYSYHLSGKYTYLCRVPPGKESGFEMGTSVISSVPASKNVVPGSAFTRRARGK
jgi:hypothetical protein